jgi:hypothetical protein
MSQSTYCIRGRQIGPEELTTIRQFSEAHWSQGRSAISRALCEHWDWRQANGRLKDWACLGWGSAAWRVACRDAFIAWDQATRQRNLSLVVNNVRFLILPWVQSGAPGLQGTGRQYPASAQGTGVHVGLPLWRGSDARQQSCRTGAALRRPLAETQPGDQK